MAPKLSRTSFHVSRALAPRESSSRRKGTLSIVVALALLCTTADAQPVQQEPAVSYFSYFDSWGADGYALDGTERFLADKQQVTCDASQLVVYRSRTLRYAVKAHAAFVERLQRFDALLIALATSHYGRAPKRLLHRGVFSCRSQHSRKERISEHALGNAIDVIGFDFGALQRKLDSPASMPRHMRRAFSVRVQSHWSPRHARDRYHAQFLHKLAEAIRNDPSVFRGIVGPPRPRHHDHLHFDMAPWRYAMFGYDPITL